LDAGAIADAHTLLDLDERADEAVVSDPALVEIDGLDNFCAGTELNIPDLALVDLRAVHGVVRSSRPYGGKCGLQLMAHPARWAAL
jgi:hypothetical protein